jgi:fumarate reductase flavoprotein subunit
VILTTGGYGASQPLLRRFHPQFDRLVTQGPPHATGDAIELAERIGGTVVNEDVVIPMMGAIEDPDRPGFRAAEGLLSFGRPPALAGDIWVNATGCRFVAEDNPSPDARERAILDQPGGVMFAIFDEPMRVGLTPAIATWTQQRLADDRMIRSAATLEELASILDVPAEGLARAVHDYNQAVNRHSDSLGRQALPKRIDTPPFHGVKAVSSVIVTFAGIKVSARLEVLRPDGTPIPGLFAAGEAIGGAQVQGDGFSSGMSVTPAIAFGRLAAQYAIESSQPREDQHAA